MSITRTRTIPPSRYDNVSRGGGAETVTYVQNGPFNMTRNYSSWSPSIGTGVNTAVPGRHYMCAPGHLFTQTYATPTESSIRVQGTFAMNASRPNHIGASIVNSSAELGHDGVPLVPTLEEWKRKTKALKNVSDLHLAIQFGWLPIISDVRKFARRVKNQNEILQKANAKSRTHQKVGFRFPTDTSVQSSAIDGYPAYIWDSGAIATQTNLIEQTVKTRSVDTWFEGDWDSFLPGYGWPQKQYLNKTAQWADEILGTGITPKKLWDLAPWSWAIDWFTNTGDILDAFSNFMVDGLVLRNAFVMQHFKNDCKIEWSTSALTQQKNSVGHGSAYSILEVKQRYPSVPYFGFGTIGALTTRQTSILVALGISKA